MIEIVAYMNESKISQLIDINNEQDLINELYTLVDEFYNDHSVVENSAYEFFNWLVERKQKDLLEEVDDVIKKLKQEGNIL